MKKFFYVAVLALAFASCGKKEAAKEATENQPVATDVVPPVATDVLPEVVEMGTEIVPAAATEVLPAAAPGPDAGGKVATEIVK
ncbi:MAG: hypothetical protein IIW77_01905 [Bacteroidaceae bacterium]|jgi:hypothetical protein|nr:hypothetical protein [Bacteroidaceae bacterium]